jgi:hypothetical protein
MGRFTIIAVWGVWMLPACGEKAGDDQGGAEDADADADADTDVTASCPGLLTQTLPSR